MRTTQDVDFLLSPSRENARRIAHVIDAFGFGSAGIPFELFEKPGSAVHLGVEPNRIALLTRLQGVDTASILAEADRVEIDGVLVKIISLAHLVEVKRSSRRPRDLADADELTRIREEVG